ncbi:MAG: ribulose-phosphate 3-epimerase [archaeon]
MNILISPSILSADRDNLNKDVKTVEKSANWIHIDIMDGKFVPPTTFKHTEIAAIKTDLKKDVHLMVDHPLTENYIDDYIKAGAHIITIHVECKDDIETCLRYIRRKGVKTGISINPPTKLINIKKYLDDVDMVLVMSVNPGYAGQPFLPEVLEKIKTLRERKPYLDIQIDGGITDQTIEQAAIAGANIFVAGSFVFKQRDRNEAVRSLRSIAEHIDRRRTELSCIYYMMHDKAFSIKDFSIALRNMSDARIYLSEIFNRRCADTVLTSKFLNQLFAEGWLDRHSASKKFWVSKNGEELIKGTELSRKRKWSRGSAEKPELKSELLSDAPALAVKILDALLPYVQFFRSVHKKVFTFNGFKQVISGLENDSSFMQEYKAVFQLKGKVNLRVHLAKLLKREGFITEVSHYAKTYYQIDMDKYNELKKKLEG